ncbi:FUSC family protein [Streptomyces sodiiphilus]|uniref:FUSC family protein n=1 Tax=Streptomyces sodiiphilus TaxID=226217 RepID=UPI0031D16450
MPEVSERVVELASRRNEPVVVQTLRSTAAATLAYLAALWLVDVPAPLLAPLTALLVVQVTLFATLTSGIRRVNAVVAGVTVAVGFSALMGLSWWSLGLLILASLTVGHLVRAGQFVPEVAISAMLVLGVTRVAETALDRVLETLIGAVVGLLFNVIFVPPVWVRSAEEAIEDLAGRMRRLLLRVGDEVRGPSLVEDAAEKLHEARRLDNDVAQVDASLTQAEESLRFNPRVKEGLLSRVVLRTGLDTLEICTVILRTMSRNLTDLARVRTREDLFPPVVEDTLEELFGHLAGAVDAFAVLITSEVSASSEQAEERLGEELAAARDSRERLAHLLLGHIRRHPRQWHLYGSLLAETDRMLDELDVEKRSVRLAEELDRYTREQRERHPRLYRLRSRLWAGPRRRRSRP